MADIFEEVEEGLRQDKFTQAWKKYGIFAYLAAALLIGGVALNEYLKDRRAKVTEQNAARLEAALTDVDARNYEAAATGLTAIVRDDIPPSKVAAHYLAGVRLDGNGDAIAAADVLTGIVGEANDPTERLALIKAAYLQADTMSRIELEALLAPLADGDGPFSALASELIAAKALQEGDIEFARREFTFLGLAQNVPPGVKTRAENALDAMPPMAAEDVTGSNLEETEETDVPAIPGAEEQTEETPQ
ncbi:MAG: hypothetical protein AAGB16_03350 [Pseudomonadota bacterium]